MTLVRETREVLIHRARSAMRSAEAETVLNRARIHIQAAERWLSLAERKPKSDGDRATVETSGSAEPRFGRRDTFPIG